MSRINSEKICRFHVAYLRSIPGVRSPQVSAAPVAAYLVTNQRGRNRASHPECDSANANAAPRPQTALSVVPSFKRSTCARPIPGSRRPTIQWSKTQPTLRRTTRATGPDPVPTGVGPSALRPSRAPSSSGHYKSYVDRTSPFHWRKWRKGVRKEGLFEGDLIVYTLAAHLTTVGNIPVKYHFDPEESEDMPIPPIDAMILCIQGVRSDHHSHSVLRSSWIAYVELESDEDNNFILAADDHDNVPRAEAPISFQLDVHI
ncbi:hypothetical protein B0H17DRAFT_1123767 [Mycena rosella]|uniref:Uncharacterized protein n=1 Tax=Mycena rosella TaxID=1033263 RepID=A0AAD7MCN0_MYCRO|nr:hypothetical protein B0H17DRAFT_1123767 [Mycena rosella]